MAEDFYSAGGYTREQEAYLQSLRDAFNDLAGRYPGAALIMPDFMNPWYNQPSEDPNVEVDTWTPHYAPGSEIDKAMASGLTPEQMISNLGYGVVNYGDVKTGGTKTGTPGVGYQYMTPGQTYTLIDNTTGKQMGPSATTPEELRALSDLANFTSNSSGNKADWSIVTGYGGDAQKAVASDVRDPDDNLDWLYGLLAAAAAVAAPYALGALGTVSAGAGAAGAAGAGAAGAGTAGALGALAPFVGETVLSTAVAPSLLSTLVPAAVAGGAVGAGLSSLGQTPVSPGVEETVSTAAPTAPVPAAPAVAAGGLAATGSALPVETTVPTAEAPASSNINDLLDTLAAGSALPPIVGGETTTVTGSTTPSQTDLNVNDALAGAIAGIGATVPSLPATTPATPAPTPSSPDYLSYIRTALGLASLLGGGAGGSGSGAGTGTVPGGAGQMPAGFGGGAGSLPTGSNIPSFGGGTSAADRAPRDMSGIDWNRYGFGPERSFFANVPQRFAAGGPMTQRPASKQAFAVKGPGDGRSDDIPAVLSDGEYVIDAETVALLGNGSNKAGAAKLDRFRANVRKHKGKELAKGRFSANAKNPQAYMAGGRS